MKPGTTPNPLLAPTACRRFCFLLLALLTLLAVSARADIQFDVFPGYEGVVAEAGWFPIVCEIKNDGPGFVGRVRISSYRSDQERDFVIELPTGTLKRLTIPVFTMSRYQNSWDVLLVDEHDRVRAVHKNVAPTKEVPGGASIIGALARNANTGPTLHQVSTRDSSLQPVVARYPGASVIADNPLVWEGMDTFYLNSERAPDLSASQVEALMEWLHNGGHLIVGLESVADVNSISWLKALFPCDLENSRPITGHSVLQDWLHSTSGDPVDSLSTKPRSALRATPSFVGNPFSNLTDDPDFEKTELPVGIGALRPGAHSLVSAGEMPLIATWHQGRGRVTGLLFSPEREPLRSWKNLPVFWAKVAGIPTELYTSENVFYRSGYSIDGVFGAMIDSKQVRKLPVEWLLLLLIVYLLVIGPFDHYWLRRIRRPMLTWITFPCYVVAFSLMIYFIGYKLRAGETEWNELHFVDVLPRGEGAELRGRTYASIYSPVNNTYHVQSHEHFASFRGEFQGNYGGAEETERASVTQNGDNYKADIFVPVWTSQLYASDWWQPADTAPLTVTLSPNGRDWQATIHNQRDRALPDVRLVMGSRIIELGALQPSQTRIVQVRSSDGMPLSQFVSGKAAAFQAASQMRHNAFGQSFSTGMADLAGCSMAISFISQFNQESFVMPPGLDLSVFDQEGMAVVLAWEPNYSPIAPVNQFPTRRSDKNTLWRIVAAPAAPAAP